MSERNPMCCGASMTPTGTRTATSVTGVVVHSNTWVCVQCRCRLAFPFRLEAPTKPAGTNHVNVRGA